MTTTWTRRDALMVLGGSAVGLMLSPLPWKLLDDVAIRTQNYPWAVPAPRGRQTSRLTRCALCPAGCALRVRSVNGRPFALAPVPGDLASRGTACALGLGAAQLAYHPDRLTGPVRRLGPASITARVPVAPTGAVHLVSRWLGAARHAAGPEAVAVLDGWPGRERSLRYRRFLASVGGGTYIAAPDEGAFLGRFSGLLDLHPAPLGADLERAGTVLSFGAPPLLPRSAVERGLTLIHAGPRRPAQAALADVWLPIRPGTEATLALALAFVLLETPPGSGSLANLVAEEREPLLALLARFTPEAAAAITGLAPAAIGQAAMRLRSAVPAVAMAGIDAAAGPLAPGDEIAIALLGVALGSVGRVGGILPRAELPDASEDLERVPVRDLPAVPDGSIHLLLLDGADPGLALPWSLVATKLAPGARVVSFAPYLSGMATRADLIVPAPAPLEGLAEIPGSPVLAQAALGVAAPLLSPPPGCREPGDFLAAVAAATGLPEIEAAPVESRLRRRVEAIHRAGRGTVIRAGGGEASELSALSSSADLWDLLLAGGRWIDAPATPPRLHSALRLPPGSMALLAAAGGGAGQRPARPGEVLLVPIGIRGAVGTGSLPPALAKLCRESDLWPAAGDAFVHPDTASALRLRDGREAVLVTTAGSGRARVRIDRGAMPGVAFVAIGPGAAEFGATPGAREESLLRLCVPDAAGSWRVAPATLQEV